jgi:hypothetical protein
MKKMKNSILTLILFCFVGAMAAQSNAIDKYFNQYKDDDRFTMVYVSPKMIQMAAQIAEESVDAELTEMLQDLKGLKILKTDVNPMAFYEEAKKKINTSEFEELMTVRDKGQNVQILVKDQDNGNIVNELLLLVGGEDEFVLLSFVGKIQLNKIAKLAKQLDISGSEHLEKLDKE